MPAGPDRPEPWPPDPASAAGRLMVLILEIDDRERKDHDVLLTDLLRVAWPTFEAQDQ
jgi:hypothetical protein